jgi:predicted DNA-binding transcriptional regulator AlpA
MRGMKLNAETQIVNTKVAAAIADMSPRTLERKRVSGTGPKFLKLGKSVRYRISDIEDWLIANEHTSTSSVVVTFLEGAGIGSQLVKQEVEQ